MKALDKFIGRVSYGFSVLAQLALAAVMFLIVANIILRRFIAPIPGTVEMVELLGAIILGSGIAYCLYSGGHIFVDVMVQRLSLKKQSFIYFIVNVMLFFLNGVLSWQMVVYGLRMFGRGLATGHLGIPLWPVAFVVSIGFMLMVCISLINLVASGKIIYKGGKK